MTKDRYLHKFIKADLKDKMVFLGGPRQVGKTTLAQYIGEQDYRNYTYLNWDSREDRQDILNGKFRSESSLIIFDELGRGTSTYDGVSIAWAVVKYVHDILRSKTLFATHYHELVKLGDQLAHATNKSVKVKESKDGEVIFLHEVVSGGANRSYGIEVAKLAGLPNEIIARAKKILEQLAGENIGEVKDLMVQDGLFSTVSKTPARHPLLAELETLNPDAMTPIEALQKIREWKENLEKCG